MVRFTKLMKRSRSAKHDNSDDATDVSSKTRTSTWSSEHSSMISKLRSPVTKQLDLMVSRKLQKRKANQAMMQKIALHSWEASTEFSIINHDSHINSRDCSPYEITQYVKSQCEEVGDSKNIFYKICGSLMGVFLLFQLPWLIQFVSIAILFKFILYITEWLAWICSTNEVASIDCKEKKSIFVKMHSYFMIYSWLAAVQVGVMYLKSNFFHKDYIRNMRSAARCGFIQETEGRLGHYESKPPRENNCKSWVIPRVSQKDDWMSKRKSQITNIVSINKQILTAKMA